MNDIENMLAIVERLMVETFGFAEGDARQRLSLWKLQQHTLEGQALESLLPSLSPEDKARELLRWALEGKQLEGELRASSAQMGIDLTP